jgi:hypothetical protein
VRQRESKILHFSRKFDAKNRLFMGAPEGFAAKITEKHFRKSIQTLENKGGRTLQHRSACCRLAFSPNFIFESTVY